MGKPTWTTKKADSYSIARVIADGLDTEDKIDVSDLQIIADRLADAFDFTGEERQKFIGKALSEPRGRSGQCCGG
jgi:hypothetical protein